MKISWIPVVLGLTVVILLSMSPPGVIGGPTSEPAADEILLRINGAHGGELVFVKTPAVDAASLGVWPEKKTAVFPECSSIRAVVPAKNGSGSTVVYSQYFLHEKGTQGIEIRGIAGARSENQFVALIAFGSELVLFHLDGDDPFSDGVSSLEHNDWSLDSVRAEKMRGELSAELVNSNGSWHIQIAHRTRGQLLRTTKFSQSESGWKFKVDTVSSPVPDDGK